MNSGFLESTGRGFYCRKGDFFIDPVKPVARAVITHAHADHAVRGHGTVYCTEPTAAFMRIRYRDRAADRWIIHAANILFPVNGVEMMFLDAGHMLGSVQVLIFCNQRRFLLTGDFKLQPDETCAPYCFTEADTLILETTFARPGLRHPDIEQEMQKLNSFSGKNIILGAYSLGKAQRLSKLLSRHCPGKMLFVHPEIRPFHQAYEACGVDTGKWLPYSARRFRGARNNVYLVPPRSFSGYRHSRLHHRAFASGWQHLQAHCDIPLFISDHADWYDLLEVVEKTKASEVWTMHGDGRFLASHLKEKDIEVRCLN